MATQPSAATTRHKLLPATKRTLRALEARRRAYVSRRPHRSFQLTRRRDYRRALALPGYWRLGGQVWLLLWRHKWLFGWLAVWYVALSAALVGIASQDAYNQLGTTLTSSGIDVAVGNFAPLVKGGVTYLSAITGGFNTAPDAGQQAYVALLVLLTWLTTIWLLRAVMAGQHPRLRDGIYHAGAPIVPTFLVTLVLLVQALPIAIVAIGYNAASTSGLLAGGVEAMLFWIAAALLVCLSLYWMTATFVALVVVTLPGMYPMRALKSAGELMMGRRLRIILRLVWLLWLLFLGLSLTVFPLVLFDDWLKSVLPSTTGIPIVPWALLIASGLCLIYAAAYIYVLYRKVVDDDATPATN